MGCFSPDEPPQPTYGGVGQSTLNSQLSLAPQELAAEQEYQPQYTNLALQNLTSTLEGTPAGPRPLTTNMTAGRTGWYDSEGNFVSPGVMQSSGGGGGGLFGDILDATGVLAGVPPGTGQIVGSLLGGGSSSGYVPGAAPAPGDQWVTGGGNFAVTNIVNQPAIPGLEQLLAQANTTQRTSDIADVAALGPTATNAILNANPGQAAILNSLNGQASAELQAGGGLTPDQVTAMQQASRAAFAARGMTNTNSGVADELLRQFNLSQSLLQQRQQFAQSVLGSNQQVIGDPFMQILGRSSGAVAQGQGVNGSAGPALFNPQAGLGLAQSNYQTSAAFDAAVPTGFEDATSALSALGSVAGGAAKAGAF